MAQRAEVASASDDRAASEPGSDRLQRATSRDKHAQPPRRTNAGILQPVPREELKVNHDHDAEQQPGAQTESVSEGVCELRPDWATQIHRLSIDRID